MPRTRETFTRHELFDVWITERQREGRLKSRSNAWFRDQTAYSYATPIGHIERNDAGERCLIITRRNYSSTSSKHVSSLRSAAWGACRETGVPVFSFDEVKSGGWNSRCPSVYNEHGVTALHEYRLAEFHADIEKYLSKAARARTTGPMWEERLRERRAELAAYVNFFRLTDLTVWLAAHAR